MTNGVEGVVVEKELKERNVEKLKKRHEERSVEREKLRKEDELKENKNLTI